MKMQSTVTIRPGSRPGTEATARGLDLPPIEAVQALAPDEASTILPQLVTLAVVAASRTAARRNEEDDTFVSLKDAAAALLTTEDWLRRNRHRLPFVVELSEGQVRVSWKALQRFMRQKVRERT